MQLAYSVDDMSSCQWGTAEIGSSLVDVFRGSAGASGLLVDVSWDASGISGLLVLGSLGTLQVGTMH